MVKKNRMTTAQMILRYPLWSAKRLEKNSGMVREFLETTECFLSLLATKSQEVYDPMRRPIPIQACPSPIRTMDPGSPIRSQPLMSDACADMALTYGPNDLPPRM